MPVPALGLRVVDGEMAVRVTSGQRVFARRLVDLGYAFTDRAPRDVLGAAT